MFKKIIVSTIIIGTLNLVGFASAFAGTETAKDRRLAEKVKASIQKLGTGESAKVRVKLKDKSELGGYVTSAESESFIVVESRSGQAIQVEYSQVRKVKGNNLSTGAKIGIGVGIAIAAIVIAVIANRKTCSNSLCQ